MTSAFKPTRHELNRVQYLARECELEMGVTDRLGTYEDYIASMANTAE